MALLKNMCISTNRAILYVLTDPGIRQDRISQSSQLRRQLPPLPDVQRPSDVTKSRRHRRRGTGSPSQTVAAGSPSPKGVTAGKPDLAEVAKGLLLKIDPYQGPQSTFVLIGPLLPTIQ